MTHSTPPPAADQQILPPPEDLTVRQALAVLYHLQHWEAIHERRTEPYGPGLFYRQATQVLAGLTNTAPKTALAHLDTRRCFVCNDPTPTIDHLQARANGGPDIIANYALLCRRHNSSKGTKDLLHWWLGEAFAPGDLPRQVLCLYTRLLWQTLPLPTLRESADHVLQTFVQARAASLSRTHLEALYGAAYATCWLATLARKAMP